ncbi:MAG: hypothetical protein GXY77_02495 [Fibrobacter sp.]|nr:hypothetical protein [Fibrobacter sp.]
MSPFIIICVLFLIVLLSLKIKSSIKARTTEYYCTDCGYTGRTKRRYQGDGFIELILWLSFIIPGLIYSIWRSSKLLAICPVCNNHNTIPADSPAAIEATSMMKCPYCSEQIKKDAIKCRFCGSDLNKSEVVEIEVI